MRDMIRNLEEATQAFRLGLVQRGFDLRKIEARVKPGNSRLFTNHHEVYHLKFTTQPFRPEADKQGPARELHLKLHYAMKTFGFRSESHLMPNERGTMVGIDEDLTLSLLELMRQGLSAYVVTVLGRGLILWLEANDFYNFVMRHDTFIKYPRSGVPVCYVPTGYFLTWTEPVICAPALDT